MTASRSCMSSLVVSASAVIMLAACSAPVVPTPTAAPSAAITPAPATLPPQTSPQIATPPTASPLPTPSGTPGSTPTPAQSPLASLQPGLQIDEAEISRHLDALAQIAADHGGIRAAGTPGYDASADYVFGELEAMGYDVERQPADFTFFDEASPVSLIIGGTTWSGPEWVHAMLYSPGGNVAGNFELVANGCEESDWDDFPRGRIAVTFVAPCARRTQVLHAQEAGAIALVATYTWAANEIRRPTLFDPAGLEIPAVAAGEDVAGAFIGAADNDELVELRVEVTTRPAVNDNVIATLAGNTDRVIMLGGHLDSALDSPGVNDNGSGVATLLAMAAALKTQPVPEVTVRFAFWAAHELGVKGSTHYLDELSSADGELIDAYINLDMVASPNAARFVYDGQFAAPGSTDIAEDLLGAFADLGSPGLTVSSGGSDDAPFAAEGIPTGGVFSGIAPITSEEAEIFGAQVGVPADPCYHLPCDDRANIDLASALLHGTAVMSFVEMRAFPDH